MVHRDEMTCKEGTLGRVMIEKPAVDGPVDRPEFNGFVLHDVKDLFSLQLAGASPCLEGNISSSNSSSDSWLFSTFYQIK